MTTVATLLKLQKVTKHYVAAAGRGAGSPCCESDLAIAAGESLAIPWAERSGKSTLLNLLGTLDQPTSGASGSTGVDLSTLREEDSRAVRNRQMGFIFQSHHLLPQCSVLENVLVPTLAGRGPEDPHRRGERARKFFSASGWNPPAPSAGPALGRERQRVAVVRALINQPKPPPRRRTHRRAPTAPAPSRWANCWPD